jgi:hypothetical protein
VFVSQNVNHGRTVGRWHVRDVCTDVMQYSKNYCYMNDFQSKRADSSSCLVHSSVEDPTALEDIPKFPSSGH